MTRGVSWFLVAPLVLLGLSGCKFGLEQREPWRSDAEERCRAEGLVRPSAFIVEDRALNGAGTCGMDHAYRITAFSQGTVEVAPRATLACPMTSAVDRWITEGVQPAAMAWFGQPVVKVKQMSSYSCRRMNGARTGSISEHAFGNGLDVGGFVLADGREVSVKKGWKGAPDEAGFLRTVQADACQRFSVVLAPGSNVYHYDHIHIDLMRRAPGRTTCKPAPVVPRPSNVPVFKAPPYKAPPFGQPWARPMGSPAGEPEVEQEIDEDYPPEAAAPAAPATPTASAYPAPATARARAPAATWGAPARAPTPPPARAASQGVGAPMVLSPPPAASGYPPPSYPAAADPYDNAAPSYPPPPAYPAQSYPAQAYPAPSAYPPPTPYPSASDYPAQPYPARPTPAPAAAPSRPRAPGVPLPPANVPLAKWLGLDPTPTGSTGNVRSFTSEREFASPIPAPRERRD